MKILIIGKNSYIGNHISEWLIKDGYDVDQLDSLSSVWKTFDYSQYSTIVHVAGIVHQPRCKDWELYRRVNAEMPIEIAIMAKAQGVKQFILLSTMAIYGIEKKMTTNVINNNTPLIPSGMYGKSKLMAEEGLMELDDELFNVVIVRPPNVYGYGCRGGYIPGFVRIAQLLPIIPQINDSVRQSFIYIDNLCELIRLIIANKLKGIFCPQDDKSVSANELLFIISDILGVKYRSSRILGMIIQLFKFLPIVNKVYGGVEYSRELSSIEGLKYVIVPFNEGMRMTLQDDKNI